MEIKCSHCGYEWETKSKLENITCPNCQLKVKMKSGFIYNEKKDSQC
jgi:DNA-directed RNA polymerase subunit RPC12/RpoP